MRLELVLLSMVITSSLLFQFHKGAIRTIRWKHSSLLQLYFNSIKVRLERSIRYCPYVYRVNFNSIKVRLEHWATCRTRTCDPYFNSIKVRLEHTYPIESELILKFQFHKGAIRTYVPPKIRYALLGFQFHKGAIRTTNNFVSPRLSAISIP